MNYIPENIIKNKEQFYKRVKKVDSGCWEWQGHCNGSGYGITFGKFRAHRVSYAMHFGVDPIGKLVCHRCDNRKCVNPDHLFLGTDLDNMHDMIAKGRARPNVTGLESPLAKMDQETLDKMSAMYLSDPLMTQRKLAKIFNLSCARVFYWLKYNKTPMKHKWHSRDVKRGKSKTS